jgi:hypothetical protein
MKLGWAGSISCSAPSQCSSGILRINRLFFSGSTIQLDPDELQFLRGPSVIVTMVRSTTDSTRFTATGVWAHTKPGKSVRSTTLDFADPAPPNETPHQKVKRLREAANRAKLAQITKWDWAYLYGRMAADMAHKGTVYGIIFATGTQIPGQLDCVTEFFSYKATSNRILIHI